MFLEQEMGNTGPLSLRYKVDSGEWVYVFLCGNIGYVSKNDINVNVCLIIDWRLINSTNIICIVAKQIN